MALVLVRPLEYYYRRKMGLGGSGTRYICVPFLLCIHVICIVFHWSQDGDEGGESVTPALDFHMEKVKTTTKQFYRDWSSEWQSLLV